ncbi:MAG: DMT family transporter [Anaerolineae bacterium]|nr:DMT family transporter [Anaerolineae bacterium]
MSQHLGELVALITATLWAFSSLFFTRASHQVGSQAVNRVRLLLATIFLSLAHRLLQGTFFPVAIDAQRWGWLTLSAIIGLVLGDGLLFYTYTLIGPRLAMLLMAAVPVISTLVAWVFLGETLQGIEMLAIAITVTGIGWVVMERQPSHDLPQQPRRFATGILCGLGAAAGQAFGLILSKQGMFGGFPALSASLIRVTTAAAIIWLLAIAQRQAGATLSTLRKPDSRNPILVGTIFGPVMGMTLSLVAVQASEVGIASTLMQRTL